MLKEKRQRRKVVSFYANTFSSLYFTTFRYTVLFRVISTWKWNIINLLRGAVKVYVYALFDHCKMTDKTKFKVGTREYKVISKDNQPSQKKIGTSVANKAALKRPFTRRGDTRIAIDARRIHCSLWKRSHDDSVMNDA